MYYLKQISILLYTIAALFSAVLARPDSAGHAPVPGPGLSYGGIPYGSMSGNVAEYFRKAPPSGRAANSINFKPIEHWLR